MKAAGYSVVAWVDDMFSKGITSFYKVETENNFIDISSQTYKAKPGGDAFIVMKNFANQTIWKKNNACRTYHLGDDVIGLEWYTKMGSIGGEVLEGIQRSIAIAEDKYKGLVIANDGANFRPRQCCDDIQWWPSNRITMKSTWLSDGSANDDACAVFIHPCGTGPNDLHWAAVAEMSLHADKVIAAAENLYWSCWSGDRRDTGWRRNQGICFACSRWNAQWWTWNNHLTKPFPNDRNCQSGHLCTKPLTWVFTGKERMRSASIPPGELLKLKKLWYNCMMMAM